MFFQILLTGSHALNILFHYPIKSKINTSNKQNMGFSSVPNLVPWLIFKSITSASELESSLISFTEGRWDEERERKKRGGDKRKRRSLKGWGGGQLFEGGDYFKFYFPSKGDDYSRDAINRGTAIWFEKIRYLWSKKQLPGLCKFLPSYHWLMAFGVNLEWKHQIENGDS